MNNRLLLAAYFFFLSGCSSHEIFRDRLVMKNDLYYDGSSDKPFSGHAISKYADGNISSDINIEDGVPKGKWVSYDYHNKIAQQGDYSPLPLAFEKPFNNIARANIYTRTEGGVTVKEMYVVFRNREVDWDALRAYIHKWLTLHPIKGIDQTTIIEFVSGEI